MKIILLQDIPKIGKKDEIKDLAPGYAQNVFLAKNLAVRATPIELDKLKKREKEALNKKENEDREFNEILNTLGDTKITIKAKASPKGSLFKAINENDIILAISKRINKTLPSEMIANLHIKTLGEHVVILKHGNKQGKCVVIVEQ